MKTKLLILLFWVCIAALVGYFMARDPGYVLLTWEGHTIQTSIWLFLGGVLIGAWLVHYSFKFIRGLSGATLKIRDWQENRKRTRSQDLTSRGLLYFQEGDFARAEKFLLSGAEHHLSPVYNYIAAAKSADQAGDSQARQQYLRQALDVDKRAANAVDMASAEMASRRGEWSLCLENLSGLKTNSAVLDLKWRAFYHTQQWPEFLALLPELKKRLPEDELTRLETEAVSGLLTAAVTSSGNIDAKAIFKKASPAVKQQDQVILNYIACLSDEKQSEAALRQILNKNWQPSLLDAYANLGESTLVKRLKTAEAWRKIHTDDAALHYCIGRLHELAGDRDKAKEAYEKSVQQDNYAPAGQQLAGLLAFEGDYQQSNAYLKLALKP